MIVTTMSILSGAMAPSVNAYVEEAKSVKARHDVSTLSVVLVRLFNDVSGQANEDGRWETYELLVGNGLTAQSATAESLPWTTPAGRRGVGALDDHLITNATEYTPYRLRAPFGWRGPYLQDPVGPDPWGHRYAVNVAAMRSVESATVVLSTGPDGLAQSRWDVTGLAARGDDVTALVSSRGRFQ